MKIGDIVTIKDTGYLYSTYYDMFKKLGFKNPTSPHNKLYEEKSKVKYTIFSKIKHTDEGTMLYAVIDKIGNQYLVSKAGLSRCSV
jgi:hypothetical protein